MLQEELPSPIDDEDAITVYGKKSVRLPYGFHATKELLSHEIAIPGKQHAPCLIYSVTIYGH